MSNAPTTLSKSHSNSTNLDHFDLILGTAGHIDHGKTSLIKALTGVDTDRLPEEKKRGITIELGYAYLDLPPFRLGIVDVPGHEKFVRQMLAGATGMDLALLVVAADDSVKQQTIEHLDILKLLNLHHGVIALTKSDLMDTDWLDLVEAEIAELVADSFLADAPIIRTSAKTGLGLDELKQALLAASRLAWTNLTGQPADPAGKTAHDIDPQNDPACDTKPLRLPFRMAIDRSFSVAGFGTVVTGSVSGGSLSVGDLVEIQPGGQTARVRSLQNHDSTVESVNRGQRAAINLAGVSLAEMDRGHELASPGYLVPSRLITVRLTILERASRSLKDRSSIRLHLGTAEVPGNVRLLDATELQPGQSGWAQIQVAEPIVATWNQPFVIRQPSPVETLGGGVVLHPHSQLLKKPTSLELNRIADLASPDPICRAGAAALFSNSSNWEPVELARTAGIFDPQPVFQQLKEQDILIEVPVSASRTIIVPRQQIQIVGERIIKTLERLHKRHPLRFAHPLLTLKQEFEYLNQPQLVELAIEHLKKQKWVNANITTIALVGSGPKLSKSQKQLLEQLVQQFKQKKLLAPLVSELESTATKNKDSIVELLALAVENGDLVKISNDLYLHQQTMQEVFDKLTTALTSSDGLPVSDIRQVLDTTRKYAVPICEYCDQIGFTVREGDLRKLNPKPLNQQLEPEN